jgi:hypothetical protein
MMVMYFSHPKVTGFWHWTFADVRNTVDWDYALFNYDGTPKVNGRIWMDLMDGFFNTGELLITDTLGEADIRGYYGRYDAVVEKGNKVYAGSFNIDSIHTDSVTIVYLDKGYTLSGLEDSAAYELDRSLNIEVSAFSNQGVIRTIGLFLNTDSIGGHADSILTMDYVPTNSVEGWNEFMVWIYDDEGNSFSHSIDVFFGDTLPGMEILSQPADTIYSGSTGNVISFRVSETYARIDSIIVSYADTTFFHTGTSGTFEYHVDELPVDDYQFIIKVTDIKGGKTSDTVSFTVSLADNILPLIEITSPEDSSTIYYGSKTTLTIDASDSDGSLAIVEVFLNQSLSHTFYESPYSLELDTLSIGIYEIVARATDDRDGQAADTLFLKVEESLSAASGLSPDHSSLHIYPNPVSDILYFSKICDYSVFTIQGKKVLEGKGVARVDVSPLKEGFYVVRLHDRVFKLSKE